MIEFPSTSKELLKALSHRGIKQLASLDFETYYSKDYTLRKLSTTEYIRHEEFKVQSLAIRYGKQRRARAFGPDNVARQLASVDWSTTALIAHHTQFDGFILSHHYDIHPAYYICTLSMARPLHGGTIKNDLDTVARHYRVGNKLPNILAETKGVRDLPPELLKKLLEYNRTDVDVMDAVFEKMLATGQFSIDEFDLIHHTIRAYTEPVLKVNRALAKREHTREVKRRKELVEATGQDQKTLRSREKFADLLRAEGVEPPKKISPANGKPTYAFAKNDLEFQKLKHHPSDIVKNLIEARLIVSSSISETRALRLLSHSENGVSLPIYLKYGGAHTLRWSGGDKMNPQNMKARGPGSELREAIKAPPGYVLIVVDSGQIEARVNAWLAGQLDLLEQFRAKDAGDNSKDPYKIMASVAFGVPVDLVTAIQRFVGKTCVLGLGYQMGAAKLHYTLISGSQGPPVDCTLEECMDWVRRYREVNDKIVDQWGFMQKTALLTMGGKISGEVDYGPITFKKGGYISANGMFMNYPNLKPGSIEGKKNPFAKDGAVIPKYNEWTYGDGVKLYGGKMTENVIQNLARHVVAKQILRVSDDYRLVLQVHDEGVWCVPRKQAESALEKILESFHTPPEWAKGLPVIGEGAISTTYVKP